MSYAFRNSPASSAKRRKRLSLRRQAGDTLIEVTLALTILSIVLVGSTLLATRAFNLGQSAKEDTVAANLIQQQAEALRNYRDSNVAGNINGTDWNTFQVATASSLVHPSFYMTDNGSAWAVAYGSESLQIYTISIVGTPVVGTNDEEMKYDVTAQWQPQVGGPMSSLTISTYLVDLDILAPCNGGGGGCP